MASKANRFRRKLLSSVTFAPLALLGGIVVSALCAERDARAQDAQVADVIVSGGGNGETSRPVMQAQKKPRAIVVVPRKTAIRERLERLEDFAQKVPNYRPNIGNPRTSTPAIRGVGVGAGTGDGAESDTGFVVDNVFYKHILFQWNDFIDIDSFEVALGPQGFAFGKNTTVGDIVIRTQLPSFERKVTFDTAFANYNRVIEKINATGPIIDDKLAYRVSAYYDKGDGFVQNPSTGATMLDNNRWGAKGQLLYVGDEITDRFIFNFGKSNEYNNNNTGDFANSFLIYANGTLPARRYEDNLRLRLGRFPLSYDPYTQYTTRQGTLDQRMYTASNELNWNIGENTLTSISAWGEAHLHPRNQNGRQLLDITSGAYDVTVDQFSQEVRLASPKEQPLEWVFGLYSFYEKIWSYRHDDYGVDAAKWYVSPAADPSLLAFAQQRRDGKSRTFQVAGFGQATYHFDEKLALTLGLRDGYELKQGSTFGWVNTWNTNFPFVDIYNGIRTGAGNSGFYDTGGQSQGLNSFTGVFNPQYQYDENIMVYGLVGRGEKAGQVNTDARPIWDGVNFKGFFPTITRPEVSWDYEIGAKTNWFDGSLFVNVNLYWNDLYNFQTNLTDPNIRNSLGTPLNTTFLGNAPHVRLRGVEFDGRWNPAERLWLTWSGAYTEARWIDFADAPPPEDWQWPAANANPWRRPPTLSLSNTRWNNLPKWSFNVGFNYEHPLGAALADLGEWANHGVTAFVYGNANWTDKTQLTNPRSIIQYWQRAYTLLNFGAGLKTEDERYSMQLYVKNLLDERPYQTWAPGNATTAATVGLWRFPRQIGGSFRVTF
jgi:iron complex outermembrane receptor protein